MDALTLRLRPKDAPVLGGGDSQDVASPALPLVQRVEAVHRGQKPKGHRGHLPRPLPRVLKVQKLVLGVPGRSVG